MDDMENEEMAAEMATAMGFSSFGDSKKRKYDQTKSPKAKADASGANTTRLGVRSKAEHGEHVPEPINDTMEADASKAAAGSRDAAPKNKTKQKQKLPAATGLAAFLSRGKDLPERPTQADENQTTLPPSQGNPDASWTVSFGGPAIPKAELDALRKGAKDENGDRAYFLPSFVEDPWENLLQ